MISLYIPERGVRNVYHFLIYMLSNLRHIDFIPDAIYIDFKCEHFNNNHDYVTEILSTLYPNASIMDTKRHNTPTDCISLPQHNSDPRCREGGIDSNAYVFLRNLLLPHIEKYVPSTQYSKYIYISRFDTNKRRILNEDSILHLCTFKTPTKWAVMSEQGDADCAFEMRNGVNDEILPGFQKIIMTNMPLLEQMYIFANAKVIISCHGAALVNTLFCNKEVKIIEIASQKIARLLHFQHIAETIGLNYRRFCNVDEIQEDNYDSDLIINDIDQFHNMVFDK